MGASSLDVSLAGSFAVTDEIALGPEVTYTQVFWTNGERYSTDARFIVGGIALTWRPVSSPAPPERVRTIERTRVVRTIERDLLLEPVAAPPPDPVALDRLLDRALPVTHREEVVLIPPILFEYDSTRILPEGEVALHAARDLIARMPDDIAIEGHADGRGTDEYNADLSLGRVLRTRASVSSARTRVPDDAAKIAWRHRELRLHCRGVLAPPRGRDALLRRLPGSCAPRSVTRSTSSPSREASCVSRALRPSRTSTSTPRA